MDFSKLSSNEKMVVYSSAVVVIAGIVSNWGGVIWLSVLAAALAIAVIFLPQFSPTTTLPGSKGSLLLVLGAVAAAGAVIELLRFLNYFFRTLDDWQTWAFAIALAAALVLAWTAWQILQAEGGKFVFGSSSAAGSTAGPSSMSSSEAAPPPAAPPPAAPPPAAAPPAAPAESPTAMESEAGTAADEDEDEGSEQRTF